MTAAEHFDTVIVGSGFGGSVTAQRLAEAGERVLVLERGKAYPPGSFPRSPFGLKRNFWDPGAGLHGMFDLWAFSGLDALVSSGLGGGSLIYANVLLRKDERWFVHEDLHDGGYEHWPVSRAELDPHYDRVEAGLGATPFPFGQAPYDGTAKTIALREAAEAEGLDWFLPPLAVTFAPAPGEPPVPGEPIREALPNLHGRTRQTCRMCGECDLGCNYGAKNTLDHTYLTAAHHAGAELRTRCEVRAFRPHPDGPDRGWSVSYVHHDEASEGTPTATAGLPSRTVTAGRLVLAAGTLGTTHLLLRNRGALPGLSPRIGAGFCGNGDLLSFAVRCTRDGLGGERVPRDVDPAHGPVITSAVRVGDALDENGATGRGLYVQDAGYPEFATWMLQLIDQPRALLQAAPVLAGVAARLLGDGDENLSAEASDLFGDCGLSSGVLPLLAMGRDVPDGTMSLDGDRLEVDWSKERGSDAFFDRARRVCEGLADRLGSSFADNPLWHLNRVITVHPLGGARMGRSDAEGVVDAHGRVFNLPGLHVADGSVMPGPVGANPSLTIAALADRFCDGMLDGLPEPAVRPARRAGSAQGAPPAAAARPRSPAAASLAFTEEMKGFCSFAEDDYDRAYRAGKAARERLAFRLTITATDVERFLADPAHEAVATGWVRCDALGGERPVTAGRFNLFVDRPGGGAERKRMYYRLPFADGAGHPLTFVGFKEVQDDRGLDLWSDTSTLFSRVLMGDVEPEEEPGAAVLATGILHIHPLDFARQLTTFRVDPARRIDLLGRFGALFAGDLWDVYRGGAGR